ncbi:MAG: helix-turn-helix domain-containing protein, partial [Pseudomonadota bacterium]
NTPIKVDTRILATSNRTMADEVKSGRFREDLFFRLNVVNIVVPSLRDRPEDIPLLAEHFSKKYAEANGLSECSISDSAMTLLRRHSWRGNVRELENTMHRAVLLATDNQIEPESILLTSQMTHEATATEAEIATAADASAAQGERPAAEAGNLVGQTVAEVERSLILDTLKHTFGNRTHAANILGISIRTLRNKLKQYSQEGVSVPPPGDLERIMG